MNRMTDFSLIVNRDVGAFAPLQLFATRDKLGALFTFHFSLFTFHFSLLNQMNLMIHQRF
ncbi:MAG: hypothetical protein EA359_17110 [Balneolaceae bacterium]|nr:MAG: hypothetical protein EA359_17110 [Balneolaceae bacterium]